MFQISHKIIFTTQLIKQLSLPQVKLSRHLTLYRVKDILSTKACKGCDAEIKGWVKGLRKMKEKYFVDVNDGSGPKNLQVVVCKDSVPERLTYGSSVEVSGQLVVNPQEQVELVAGDIRVVGPCIVTDGYPFVPRKLYEADYVRQFIHMRPRTRSFSSLLRVRHSATQALNKYFEDLGFFKIDVPVLTANDCEGAGEVFLVKPDNDKLIKEMMSPDGSPDEAFFNHKTYLTVSGQLHLEVAARAMGKVYCFGPTFRAENSRSRLHLSEFYMAEAEVAFTKSLRDILTLTEELVRGMSQHLMDTCAEEITSYAKLQNSDDTLTIEHLLRAPYTVDSYDSVCNILEKHRNQLSHPLKRGEALSKEHELFLVEHNNNVPIFVTDWPADIKPFYMKAHSNDASKVHAVDLLCANVGELCGGSLREDSYETLQTKLTENNLEEKLDWYLELRKFGNVPTGGFGMGFERFLQVVLGIPNIKDAIPFPRWPHNCKL